jgi:RNA polymerase sigma factor (sigma-70 family)
LEGELTDFVQDVFLRLFKHLPDLHNPKAFPGYFRQIVLSAAADQARRQLKDPLLRSVDEAEVLEHLVVNLDGAILTGIFVRTYLESLSNKEQRVLMLEFFEGYSTDGIAEQMRMSPSSVRVVKSRAFNKLRKLMLKDAEYLEQSSQ